jgi:MazG family protein
MSEAGAEFDRLVEVMRTLRSPEGCPWDREQTLESLTHFVLEEAHEVLDAIERGDMAALKEEIGDHVFEGVFLAQVAAESGVFTIEDSLRTVVEKLVRRHPHVFQENGLVHDAESKERAPSAEAALDRWNSLKARERSESGQRHSTLGSLAKSLPSLLRAYKIGKRVASVGFDWETSTDVIAKIEEEVAELRDTLASEPGNAARAEEEMGDLLFAIANLSRKLGIEPEAALRKANEKFTGRFNRLERNFIDAGRDLEGATLEEMEREWETIKAGMNTKIHEAKKHRRSTKEEHEDPQKEEHEDPRRLKRQFSEPDSQAESTKH